MNGYGSKIIEEPVISRNVHGPVIASNEAPKPTNPDWRTQARCRNLPLELVDEIFFDAGCTKRASIFCNACEVADDCRAFANSWSRSRGIWGGRLYGPEATK